MKITSLSLLLANFFPVYIYIYIYLYIYMLLLNTYIFHLQIFCVGDFINSLILTAYKTMSTVLGMIYLKVCQIALFLVSIKTFRFLKMFFINTMNC